MKRTVLKTILPSSITVLTLLMGCNAFQNNLLTDDVSAFSSAKSNRSDFREESIYFVMTDRFVDGDASNNNIFGDEYRPGDLKFNQGGDFKGLIDNLDYIKDMGFTAIWITPPVMQPPGRYLNDSRSYEATGYHGYWAWDFSKIDPHLESPGATYDDFIKACHEKGIKVVQDIVTNHGHGDATAPEVKWHNQRGKVYGLGKEFDFLNDPQKWFNHSGDKIADLVDFNDKNQEVIDWFVEIYKNYQNRGVDSFRIDTVAWMGNDFWTKFTDELHKNKKDFFMFGEAWTNNPNDWFVNFTKLGSVSGDWPMNRGMSLLDMPGSAMNTWGQLADTFKPGGDYGRVDGIINQDPRYTDATYLVSYLDNHDKPRFNGTGSDGRPAGQADFINGLNWYFSARGIPCVYYGTEIQMAGGNDPDNRRVLGLNGMNSAKQNAVYWQLRKLNTVRKSFIPLQKGVQKKINGARDTYVFKREFNGETAVVFLNKGGNTAQLSAQGIPDGSYTELYTGEKVNVSGGNASVNVDANGVKVLALGSVKGNPWTVPDWTKAKSVSNAVKK